MLFNAKVLAAVALFINPAVAHIRSRELTQCGEIDKCYLYNKTTKTKIELEEGEHYDYSEDQDYVLICKTTEDTVDGTPDDPADYRDGNKRIVYMWAYDGPSAQDGRDSTNVIGKAFNSDWRGEWKFRRVLTECKAETEIGVGGYINGREGARCSAKLYKFKCGDKPTPPPVPPPSPEPTPGPTPSPTPAPSACPTDKRDYYHHIDKCKMKNGELVIKFEEKCKFFDEHACFAFKSSTHYPRSEWYFEEPDYCVKDGSYDEDYYKSGECKGQEFYLPVHKMDHYTDNKDREEKPFFGYVILKNGCKSPPFKCENKNLTPLGLDLDGSGNVEMIQGEFSIDLNGDHFPETINSWFAPTEGILIDTSYGLENGVNGDHLFGDMNGQFDDGFDKLATLDNDSDGFVSGTELYNLAIWKDSNSNAALDDGELFSLGDFGIVSLNVSHEHLVSFAVLSDGSSMKVEDLYFSRSEPEAVV